MLIRPVEIKDLDGLIALANEAGTGLTSLQPNREQLKARIERSIQTFRQTAEQADQGYLFVLADSNDQPVGVCGIEVALGLSTPWYNYRVGTVSHMSASLGVAQHVPTLFLSNDHTGHSELCTLFLAPAARGNQNGQLLSKSRLLFINVFREAFGQKVVAEMRGVSDENGLSPFWESLGKHFFSMEFAKADYLSGVGDKQFIAELMPKFPIYTSLLSDDAQAVIGKVHQNTAPARKMLEAEGLQYQGYIDIFDGGATLEAYIDDLRISKESTTEIAKPMLEAETNTTALPHISYLVSNQQLINFRCILKRASSTAGASHLTDREFHLLNVDSKDTLHIVPLSPNIP